MKDQIRAILVLTHVVLVLLLATPSTASLMNRKAWKQPSVQQEFGAWGALLGGRSAEEMEELLWNVIVAYDGVREVLITPAVPYARWFGTGQGWQLFAAPERHPARIQIQVELLLPNGKWRYQTIYLSRSDEHTWNRGFFDQDRFRTMAYLYTWPQYRRRGMFEQFADFILPDLKEDFPEARRVRIRLLRSATPRPEEVIAGVRPPITREGTIVRELQ